MAAHFAKDVAFWSESGDIRAMHVCPHCRAPFADAPDLAGQLVSCPTCGQHVQLPRAVGGELIYAQERTVSAPYIPRDAPGVVVIATPPRERRLESQGWFARSFMSAGGVLAALAVAALLICAGLLALNAIGNRALEDDAGTVATAKVQALRALRKHGISSLAQEVVAGQTDGKWIVTGPAITREGRLAEIYVSFRVATTNRGRMWQLVDASIDGEMLVVEGVAD